MKEFFEEIKDNILDFLMQHNFIISTIINIFIMILFYDNLFNYFFKEKSEILNMLISIAGTLFGFILTFLSIFIVFKTDEKYKRNSSNKKEALIMLINNDSFYNVYNLFIKSSYSLGALLIISIIYYFITINISKFVDFIFIFLIFELIVLGIIRVFLSIYTFNTLIKILIQNDKII